MPYGAEHFEV